LQDLFFVAQQPKLRPGRLIFEMSRSHTIRHTHTHTHKPLEERFRMNDQLVAEAATCTLQTNTRNEYPYPQRDLKPRPQQSNSCRLTL